MINTYNMTANRLAFVIAALGKDVDTATSEHLFSTLVALIGYDEADAAVNAARQIITENAW
jgi:hypothetical protein